MKKKRLKDQWETLKESLSGSSGITKEGLQASVESLHLVRTDVEWADASEACYSELCEDLIFLLNSASAIVDKEDNRDLEAYFDEHMTIAQLAFCDYHGSRGRRIHIFEQTDAPIHIIGDLHGDVCSLQRILEKTHFYETQLKTERKAKWIFLGDYLDRGKRQIELLERLLVLKTLFPDSVALFRGNHELGTVKEGRIQLGIRKPESEPDSDYLLLLLESMGPKAPDQTLRLLNAMIVFFHKLSVCGFVKQGRKIYLLNHGGIVRPKHEDDGPAEDDFFLHFKRLSELTDGSVLDDLGNSLEHNLLWSDPSEDRVIISQETRRFRFHMDHFLAYRKALGFDVLIRGHEAFPEGVKHFFEKRVVSVFSSGSKGNADTAYETVTPKIVVLEHGTLSELEFAK